MLTRYSVYAVLANTFVGPEVVVTGGSSQIPVVSLPPEPSTEVRKPITEVSDGLVLAAGVQVQFILSSSLPVVIIHLREQVESDDDPVSKVVLYEITDGNETQMRYSPDLVISMVVETNGADGGSPIPPFLFGMALGGLLS